MKNVAQFLSLTFLKSWVKSNKDRGRYAMKGKMLRWGLIGKDVSKSISEAVHKFILGKFGVQCEYQRFSVAPKDFDDAMRVLMGDFDAFNVTIPYKRDVFSYLNAIKDDAMQCGAVNTVITQTGVGYNTDGGGFLLTLQTSGVDVKDKRVLVLGVGGAGRSVAVALKNAGAQVYLYRRDKQELQEACEQLGLPAADSPTQGGFDIVINCTGVGMHDTEGVSPVDQSAFVGTNVAVDLIYHPKQSEFLRIARDLGLKTVNGESMLFYQAYYADCLFLQREPNQAEAKQLYREYLAQ